MTSREMTIPELLKEAMRRHPSERALQVVFNALDAKGAARNHDGKPRDLFGVSDELLAEGLREYIGPVQKRLRRLISG